MSEGAEFCQKFSPESGLNDGDDEYDVQLQPKTEYFDETIVKQDYREEETTLQHGVYENSCTDNDLPKGWKKIDHDSGMPIYMNTETRVCSFSKPYFLGNNSLKNHEIPVANIPCLNQKLINETNVCSTSAASTSSSNRCPVTLSHAEYQNYCSKIFKFRNIKCYKFNSWVKRRKYLRKQKADLKNKDLQSSTSIPTAFNYVFKSDNKALNPEDLQHIVNLKGKSYIGILHEYSQRVLKTSCLSFVVKELEQSKYPYLSTVVIDGIQYGVGTGSTKKQAKIDSARVTLQILLPTIKDFQTDNSSQKNNCLEHYSIFDQLNIKDTRIPQFCAQSTESTPYEMLKLCVKRNFGEGANLLCEMEQIESGSDTENCYRCTMTVNKYSATVICKDKLDGRQKGAQALLKVLHPHVHYFGSLLRLYSHLHYKYNENQQNKPKTKTIEYKNNPDVNLLKKLRTTMLELESQTND